MSDSQEQARRVEFELHVAHLTETHKGFIESSGKVAGFLLLALGWFATSEGARAFLASTPTVTMLAALAAGSAYLLSLAASWLAFRVSAKALRRLRELAYVPPSAYELRVLGPVTFGVCVAGNGVLAALLIGALLGNPPK